MKPFSKKDAIRFGFRMVREHFWFLAGVTVLIGGVPFLGGFLDSALSETAPLLSFFMQLVFFVLNVIITLGTITLRLRFVDGGTPSFKDLFSSYRRFFPFVGASLLYIIIIFGGFLLFVIPGLMWSIMFLFFGYAMIDGGLGPLAALNESARITKGAKWQLFLFHLLLGLINVLGFLALGVGLFVTIPATLIASGYVYRTLQRRAGALAIPAPRLPVRYMRQGVLPVAAQQQSTKDGDSRMP